MFKVGQKVVVINVSPSPAQQQMKCVVVIPLKLGQIFTIKAISYCIECGMQNVDIGFVSIRQKVICSCGYAHRSNNTYWFGAYRFALIIETEEKSTSYIEDILPKIKEAA